MIMENKRPTWTSKYTFILAAIGSAVGLGNIWRFPYVMGKNGGAVFLLTFVFLVLTICFIPLLAELLFGKITKKECIGAFESVNPKFKVFGAMNPLNAVFIPSFYCVIGGWIVYYIFNSFTYLNKGDCGKYFTDFIQNPIAPCVCTVIFLFICTFFVVKGIKKGIEFANKIMMPLFTVILIFLVCTAISLPGATAGIEYMFKPDFSKFNTDMVFDALGQAFFTLSCGTGALLTYGSYVKEDDNIAKSAYTIVFSNIAFSLLAGLMIFPAVFSFNLEPDSGAGLAFVTLPKVFAQLPCGEFVSFAFFILLFCASVTSAVSMIEVPCATMVERYKMTRVKAGTILFFVISFFAVLATLSFGILGDFKLFNKTFFDFLDFTTSNVLLPLNSLILCIIAGWFLKIKGQTFIKNKILYNLFDIGLKYAVPIVLICLFIERLR